MQTVTKSFANEAEKQAFVFSCEAQFDAQMHQVLSQLAQGNEKVFTLSGPSCSGKTTTAHLLLKEFARVGKRVAVVSIDDFFLPRSAMEDRRSIPTREVLDYDSLAALDFPLFAECAQKICRAEAVRLPKFDFATGARLQGELLSPKDYDVVLFEGIQAIYPEVTEVLSCVPMKAIAIGVSEDVCVNGVFFDRREIRFIRRIVRDFRKRGASAEFTFYIWQSVAKNEEKNIYPHEHGADVRLSSFHPYELFVLKAPLLSVLATVPVTSPYAKEAQRLAEKVFYFPEIPEEMIPKDSMFMEFL